MTTTTEKPRLERGRLYLCKNCGFPFRAEEVKPDGSHERFAGITWTETRMVCLKAEAK